MEKGFIILTYEFLFIFAQIFISILNDLNDLYEISDVEVGQHYYWQIGGFQVHAQVLIIS
jgi:F-type H+-transporting ATPase subunit a